MKFKLTLFQILVIILSVASSSVDAQKLPNIQMTGFRAPANVKIDGKPTELDTTFRAHNAAADVLYTIANDDENLYLVVQAKDVNVINTIVGYGFEFAVQRSGRKDEKDKISVSYPIGKSAALNFGNKNGLTSDTSNGAANAVMMRNNKLLEQKLKSIIVTGIKDLDTLSIYNDTGIKAAGQFDNKKVYTFELAMPLKYLGLSADGASKLAYHMIFNGYTPENLSVVQAAMFMPGGRLKQVDGNSPEMQQAMMDLNMKIARRNPHTDFWGEYTLVKKL
jgi:hypothetical protein